LPSCPRLRPAANQSKSKRAQSKRAQSKREQALSLADGEPGRLSLAEEVQRLDEMKAGPARARMTQRPGIIQGTT
jgi:hypothetical protein